MSPWCYQNHHKTTEIIDGQEKTTNTEYVYDDEANLKCEHTVTPTETITKFYKRPYDYLEGTIDFVDMLNQRGQTATVIEQQVWKRIVVDNVIDSVLISAQVTTYTVENGICLPEKIYTLETDKPLKHNEFTEEFEIETGLYKSVIPDNNYYQLKGTFTYDGVGNLIKMQKVNDIEVSFIWGYDNKYPVAQITNSQGYFGAFTSFENGETGGGNWLYEDLEMIPLPESERISGEFCGNLKDGKTIQTGTIFFGDYTIGFWAKGNDINVGGISVTISN